MNSNSRKPFSGIPKPRKAISPNTETSKANLSKTLSSKARITNSILQILKTRKNYEFVILAFDEMVFDKLAHVCRKSTMTADMFMYYTQSNLDKSNFDKSKTSISRTFSCFPSHSYALQCKKNLFKSNTAFYISNIKICR